jgi:hypothetical protein
VVAVPSSEMPADVRSSRKCQASGFRLDHPTGCSVNPFTAC